MSKLDLDALETEIRGGQHSEGWLLTQGLWLIQRLREAEAELMTQQQITLDTWARIALLERVREAAQKLANAVVFSPPATDSFQHTMALARDDLRAALSAANEPRLSDSSTAHRAGK